MLGLARAGLLVAAAAACSKPTAPATPAQQPVTAVLRVDDVAAAVDHYEVLFGAVRRLELRGKDGEVIHSEVAIDGEVIWIDVSNETPTRLGGSSGGIRLRDANRRYQRALANQAVEIDPRTVRDRFGHVWQFAEVEGLEPFLVSPATVHPIFAAANVEVFAVAEDSNLKTPEQLGGAPFRVHVYVDDCQSFYERAIELGAKSLAAPSVMYWGDRWALVADAVGHTIGIGERLEDLTAEQMQKRLE